MKKHRFKIISLLLILTLALSPIMNVYASESTADHNSGGEGISLDGSTCTGSRSGWLLYIVDKKSGALKSDVVISWTNGAPNLGFTRNYIRSKLGNVAPSRTGYDIADKYGGPMNNGSGNGNNVRNKLIQTASNGYEEWQNVVEEIWGKQMVEDMVNHDYALVLEAVYYYTVFYGGRSTGIVLAGTPNTIAQFQSALGLDPIGDTMINRYTNQNYPESAMFQSGVTIAGLTPPTQRSGKIPNGQIQSEAYGLIAIWPVNNITHTWDHALGATPGPATENPKGYANIVKSYHTVDKTTGQDTHDGSFVRATTSDKILIEDETEYKVQNWEVTDTKNPGEIPGTNSGWNPPGSVQETGKTPDSVEIKNPGKTLYVQLIREEEKLPAVEAEPDIDYIINESQVSKQVKLSEANSNTDAQNVINGSGSGILKWTLGELQDECDGHSWSETVTDENGDPILDGNGDEITDSGTDYCTGWYISDEDVSFMLKNSLKMDYKEILADGDGWWRHPRNNGNESYAHKRAGFEEEDVEPAGWDMKMVIHRGKDKLTIAQWKNTGTILESITSAGDMYPVANTPQGTRRTKDFVDSFNVKLEGRTGEDLETSSEPETAGSHGGICEKFTDTASFDPPTISPLNVKIYTYSGSPEGGSTNAECDNSKMISHNTGNTYRTGVMVPTGEIVNFYPYIEMRYDTINDGSLDNKVYVMGQYLRSIEPNDYAEIVWTKQGNENLTLSSRQWSTHASATNGDDWRQKDSVLPGGAVMNLGIKKDDRQTVVVITWQTILEGEGLEQVNNTFGAVNGMTEADAQAYHKSYVASVMDALDGLGVQQFVSTDWDGNPFNGIAVDPQCDISGLDAADGRASNDDKYYFRDVTNGAPSAQEGDLDVREGPTSISKHTFKSDTKGNIYMDGSVILSQSQGKGSSLPGGINEPNSANCINNRTMIVDKLVDAIERDTGNDGGAKNIAPHWYNEAFDGITVIVQVTKIQTGMVDPSERAAVLDVKLTPRNSGQADLFTKAYSSQFKMKDTSAAMGEPYLAGYFQNMREMKEIYMEDMDYLYKSKKFYIPNVNVQDLR